MSKRKRKIVFLASFPPIMSAIKSGDDGARIQLDIPESEAEAIKAIHDFKRVVIRVTFEAVED